MKVKELIQKLLEQNLESEVILQKDSEGNGYSPLCGVDGHAVYVAETTYSGTAYSLNYTREDNCMSVEEWKKIREQTSCVVLVVVN